MKPIRVVLADDHALVRAGIRSLLKELAGVQVVGEATDGREAFQLAKKQRPDIVLMDIAMSGMNGLEAAQRILKAFPEVRVVILSMHANEEYVRQALRVGVSGYLIKDAATSELEIAVKAVSRGETYLSPAVAKHVIRKYKQRVAGRVSAYDQLTPRQREILQLIAEGQTTKEIASILDISLKTAQTHRIQLMERLDIRDVAGLVRYAIRIGLITAEK